jgi:hypothetical protein
MVTASLMVYYTTAFKNKTKDPKKCIRRLVRLANMVYDNSGIPLRIRAHCMEELIHFGEIPERGISRLDAFSRFKGMKYDVLLHEYSIFKKLF